VVQLLERERIRLLEQLEAIPAARAAKMGTIVFDKIVSAKSGANRAASW
jgi:hypothetical protein